MELGGGRELSSSFRNETQHCPVICRDCELDKEFLRLQLCFEFPIDLFELFDRKIFEPLFILSHIYSEEKHDLVILVSTVQEKKTRGAPI